MRVTQEEDVRVARVLVKRHHSKRNPTPPRGLGEDQAGVICQDVDKDTPLEPEPELETWSEERINTYVQGQPDAQNGKRARAVLFIDGLVVDITEYTSMHVRIRLSSHRPH